MVPNGLECKFYTEHSKLSTQNCAKSQNTPNEQRLLRLKHLAEDKAIHMATLYNRAAQKSISETLRG